MKANRLITLICLLAVLALMPGTAAAGSPADAPLPLCLPGVYEQQPADCLPLGPSAYLTRMNTRHIQLPLEPLPAVTPEYTSDDLPFNYARVRDNIALRIFGSPEEAEIGENVRQNQRAGLVYMSYDDSREYNGKRYYMIEPGGWVRPDEVSGSVLPSTEVGLELYGTPKNYFGFTIYPIHSQVAPGGEQTANFYDRYAVVQVFDWQEVNGNMWLMIGPDEWMSSNDVGVVYPASTPPEGVSNGRWIEINLYEQTIAVYEDNHMVYAALTSTGQYGWWTQPGLFQIYQKDESTNMRGAFEADFSDYYFLEDVPWTMYFDELRALHGAYWHNAFGLPRSHGCANLSPGDAKWLFEWAQLGDYVYVWDPSGATPTDPAIYGEGGA